MMSSITPVGEQARRQRWSVTVTAHLVGAVVGGVVMGLAFSGLGSLADRIVGFSASTFAIGIVAAAAALAAVLEQGPLAVAVPTMHRQVDERWLDIYRGWVYGGGYGLQLGFGLVTVVPTWATPAMLLAMLLTGSVIDGAIIGGVYGLLRGAPVLATGGLREPTSLWRFHERLDRWGTRVVALTAAGLAVVALGALAAMTTESGV